MSSSGYLRKTPSSGRGEAHKYTLMENEKRKAARIKKPLVVQYSKDGIIWDISHIRDFSETGMQVITRGILVAGEILNFRTKIPLEPFDWVEFSGKVIDSTKLKNRFDEAVSDAYITRIELINIKDEQKALLRKYVEWFLNK